MNEPSIGHNASSDLQSYADRYDRLKDEIEIANNDLKDLKEEMKSRGINEKAVAEIIKYRRMTEEKRKAKDALEADIQLYGKQLNLW